MDSAIPYNTCQDNIKKKNPPVYCGDQYCRELQPVINEYCYHHSFPCATPIPQFTNPGNKCWCCCCGNFILPLAIDDGNYQLIEDLSPGDLVRVAGRSLASWAKAPIQEIAVLQAVDGLNWGVRLRVVLSDGSDRSLALGAEALMLMSDGKLKPAGRCVWGDKLREAGGGEAKVRFSELTSANIVHPNMGSVNASADDPLEGHLLDVFGLVVADLAVQIAAFTRQLPEGLLVSLPTLPQEPIQFCSET